MMVQNAKKRRKKTDDLSEMSHNEDNLHMRRHLEEVDVPVLVHVLWRVNVKFPVRVHRYQHGSDVRLQKIAHSLWVKCDKSSAAFSRKISITGAVYWGIH